MKWTKLFIYSAGGILLAASLMRFITAAGADPALSLPEPMLGSVVRYAVLAVGILELIAALLCLFGRQTSLQLGWVAWLATDYVVYSVGLVLMHCHSRATCIGSLTDPLNLARGATGFIIGSLPLYLFFGSYAAMLWQWQAARQAKAVKFRKMSCSSCGVHIRFDERNVGQKIPCPHCQTAITLRNPHLLRMACFFCKEHIEFPAHAIGEKMPCPHCNMDITLKELA